MEKKKIMSQNQMRNIHKTRSFELNNGRMLSMMSSEN